MALADDPVDPRAHPDHPASDAPAPRANPSLVGHADAERRLARAAADGTLAGAWLIGGPPGIGKATLAYRLARHLLAGGGNDLFGDAGETLAVDPGEPAFARVAGGAHADLLAVELGPNDKGRPRTEIIVDDVRRLGPFFHRSAGEGGWRVAIIDGAELMNDSAANAALKLVEEPPVRSVVLLVSHAPARLAPTIRSRCRMLHLRAPKPEQAAVLLEQYLPKLTDEERRPLARLAGGSVGRALAFDSLGGLALYRELLARIAEAPRIDPKALHDLADRLGRRGNERACRTAMGFLGDWIARLARGAADGGSGWRDIVGGERRLMERLAQAGDLERWVDVWEKVAGLRNRADSLNLDRKQVVLAAFGALEAAART